MDLIRSEVMLVFGLSWLSDEGRLISLRIDPVRRCYILGSSSNTALLAPNRA